MEAAGSLRLFIFSVYKSLSRRARGYQRRYCSARETPTVNVTKETKLRGFKTKPSSGPSLTDFIKLSSSNKNKLPDVYEYEASYLPENPTEVNLRKGERTGETTCSLTNMGRVLIRTIVVTAE